MSIRSSSAFIAGAVVALVVGTGTAYAANGGTFRLGMSNSATKTTTLTNNYRAPLQLNTKAGQPPLRVNRATKVPSLNADLLDGLHSTSFARVTNVGSVYGTGFVHDSGTTTDTSDDAVVAVAVCPVGSQVVGGGGGDFTDDGVLFVNSPDGRDAWVVVSTATATAANAENVEAYARCWNPRASVASNMRMAPAPHELSASTLKAIDKVVAKR